MEEILLNDLLNFTEEEINNAKIKLNQASDGDDPMNLYLNNPEIINTQWLFWKQQRRYFYEGQIAICFLRLSYDTWLLTTIKKITKDLNIFDGISYEGEELKKYSSLFGRVVVKYKKTHQGQGIYFSRAQDKLIVQQILPAVYDGDNFPGYDKVRLSFAQLEAIINRRKSDWINALSNQKAVYLITDKSNGKLYVGSATSKSGMLLSRWESYVFNGHGGNFEIKELVVNKGIDYLKNNFQYSILENYNSRVDDLFILERESWWKETLDSREHGYNKN